MTIVVLIVLAGWVIVGVVWEQAQKRARDLDDLEHHRALLKELARHSEAGSGQTRSGMAGRAMAGSGQASHGETWTGGRQAPGFEPPAPTRPVDGRPPGKADQPSDSPKGTAT